ncbi:retrovirus-related pol polyprotein from transposon TNT 1-94 [Tanacetum coccineum]
MKGKSVDAKCEKPLVIRQSNAFKIQRSSVLGVISTTSVSRPQLKSNQLEDRVLHNNSQVKKNEVEDHHLEVAFWKSTCYVHDLKGNDLLTGSRRLDLYSITLQESTSPNPICLMAEAASSQAWLWHHRLSHLNFDTINLLSKNDIVTDLPKLKFVKDHLCSSCKLGKAKHHISSNPAQQCPTTVLEHGNLNPASQSQVNDSQAAETVATSLNELDMLFSLMFDEYFTRATIVVSKSSTVPTADASDKPPTVIANENINQAENVTVDEDEFINIFSTLVYEVGESSSRHVDTSNMHTFYQRHPSERHWTRDQPLEQVIRNPSKPVRKRRHLETDGEMCMFALTVSRTEPKNIKEAMPDHAWI